MRNAFREATEDILRQDARTILLLGDIGVFGFRDSLKTYPDRVFNIGVLEQATIGIAAGFAMEGMIPFVHSIAPFLIERALEQIKVDFGYQRLAGNLVSVGASLDYAALGGTHHAPGDVAALLSIPGVQILLPGSPEELQGQLTNCYANERLSYFRLSEYSHSTLTATRVGDVDLLVSGSDTAVLAIGPMLSIVEEAVDGLGASLFYMNSIDEGTGATLRERLKGYERLLVVEPYYQGTTLTVLEDLFASSSQMRVVCRGIPRAFRHAYGSTAEHYADIGLNVSALRSDIKEIMRG